jgi:hypothetical protein
LCRSFFKFPALSNNERSEFPIYWQKIRHVYLYSSREAFPNSPIVDMEASLFAVLEFSSPSWGFLEKAASAAGGKEDVSSSSSMAPAVAMATEEDEVEDALMITII